MVETYKDNDGKIIGYCEWTTCDKNGKSNLFEIIAYGEYLYIYNLWVHDKYRKGCDNLVLSDIVNTLYQNIVKKIPQAKIVYWLRGKYNKRFSAYKIKDLVDYGIRGKRTSKSTGCSERRGYVSAGY